MRRQNGEGTYYFDKTRNKWRYRKPFEWKTLSVYGDTKAECNRKMRQKEEEEKRKAAIMNPEAADRRTLAEELEVYLQDLYKNGTLKPHTYDGKEGTFNKYIKDADIGRTAIINITDRDIQEVLNEAAETKSQAVIDKICTLLAQFFSYYYRKNPSYSPMIGVIKPNVQRLRQRNGKEEETEISDNMILSDEEIEKVVACCYTHTPHYYVFPILIYSMVRYGELLALRWEQIGEEYIDITHSIGLIVDRDGEGKHKWDTNTPKSRAGKRKVYITPELKEALDKYREVMGNPTEGYLLQTRHGSPVDGTYMRRILTKVINECGIDKHITLHRLRHTGASYYIRHNGNISAISKQLGHANLSVTLRVYYHIMTEDQKKIYAS